MVVSFVQQRGDSSRESCFRVVKVEWAKGVLMNGLSGDRRGFCVIERSISLVGSRLNHGEKRKELSEERFSENAEVKKNTLLKNNATLL